MPSEHQHSQSHGHRPSLAGHRSNSSIHSQTDSPSSTPPQHGKTKPQKHVVGGGGGRIHARVPSTKSMHTALKAHGKAGSHDNLKKLGRNASATHIKKNSSHVSLKRNQSSSDVGKRAKSPHADKSKRNSAAVHFEIGDHDVEGNAEVVDDGDGWEEASSTASPALSRSASRPNSAKHSANNSEPQSPRTTTTTTPKVEVPTSPQITQADGQIEREKEREKDKEKERRAADAKIITERLLQRTPSHNTTKMSLATATPAKATSTPRTPNLDGLNNSNGTSQFGSKEEVVSRFVSGSGTPRDAQSFLHTRDSSPTKSQLQAQEDMKRAQSMGNLRTRRDSSADSSQDERRSLAPITRSRKSSIANAYTPPHTQSRTNQKLWLQRASSNIEPQNLAPPASLGITALGLGYAHAAQGGGVSGLVGSGVGYDGRDPRIKAQLERTGLEYLVVRRHQDPVGAALKRLERLPGAERNRRIPGGGKGKERDKDRDVGSLGRRSGLGLSQSLKESRKSGGSESGKGSYGSHGDGRASTGGGSDGRDGDDDGVSAILRSLWEKNYDLSSSAD